MKISENVLDYIKFTKKNGEISTRLSYIKVFYEGIYGYVKISCSLKKQVRI